MSTEHAYALTRSPGARKRCLSHFHIFRFAICVAFASSFTIYHFTGVSIHLFNANALMPFEMAGDANVNRSAGPKIMDSRAAAAQQSHTSCHRVGAVCTGANAKARLAMLDASKLSTYLTRQY